MSWQQRTQMLIGIRGLEILAGSAVALFGLGGVGSWIAETLVRAGIGNLILVDGDVINESNINRQLPATTKTIGQSKAAVVAARAREINPGICVTPMPFYYTPDTENAFDMAGWDYIIDAIDMVTAKLLLIERAKERGISILSVMGTGNKLDPTRFTVGDISKTTVCPLARIVRKELRTRNIRHVDVVWSTEDPVDTQSRTPGSISFVPPAAGLAAAAHVTKNLLEGKRAVPR